MKRRRFIQLSSASLMPVLLSQCSLLDTTNPYDITFASDMERGHSLMDGVDFTKASSITTDYLIIGGGIAGLSAAWKLKDKDYLLLELSEKLGGSSGKEDFDSVSFSQGAHYELAYPEYYGKEALAMLKELEVIAYEPWRKMWTFKDKQYVIPKVRETKTYKSGSFQSDVLEEGEEKDAFLKLISAFQGKMILPTRLIEEEFYYLNEISFLDYLKENISMSPAFIRGLDYHMMDDYGAKSDEVSALAGIHYFQCRPYYTQRVELFSPPQGNHYFIQKITDSLNPNKLLTSHMAISLNSNDEGVAAKAIDFNSKTVVDIEAKKVIYAGQKHAIKHIYKEDATLFDNNKYAPWMVVNVVLNDELDGEAFWQNEFVDEAYNFLGFVDSKSQYGNYENLRVLTCYYCFTPEERNLLKVFKGREQSIATETIKRVSKYFNTDINPYVKKVYIKVMGHAMPIPEKGYLFNENNKKRANKNVVYAGVDNGRLPLLFEALDSGLMAGELVFE